MDNSELQYFWMSFDLDSVGHSSSVGHNHINFSPNPYRVGNLDNSQWMRYASEIDIAGHQNWWFGVKTIIMDTPNWPAHGLDGNYECYIIERSNILPHEFEERFNLTYLPGPSSTKTAGATYKYYKRIFVGADGEQIKQIWTIRQYRYSDGETGWIPAGWIRNRWRHWGMLGSNGHNLYDFGFRFDLETAHEASGSASFYNLTMPPRRLN